jgi:predicted nucleic acid-binding protein
LKVVDAGVIVEVVTNDLDPSRLGDEELAVPHLIDSEVTNVALAEMTGATAQLTTDARLANAPGITCAVELI